MLEARDGDQRSYLEIVDVVTRHSSRVARDLEELWRRIAFSILVSNSDDRLRNHGFVRDGRSWVLAPSFDVNPNPGPDGVMLSTTIGFDDARADIDALVAVADYFRLGPERMRMVLDDVVCAVEQWRRVATAAGLGSQVSRLAPAFERDQLANARRIAGA